MKINLIGFVVISMGLVYLMATQVLSVLQARYSVYALFPDAGGVFTNQEVTYRGITVGQVGTMEVVPEGVKIELLILKDFDEIPADEVEARVMFKSAVGEQFVDLLPASDDAPYLADGDVIPLDQTAIPVSTQELLSTLEAVLRGVPPDALKGAVDALGIGLTGRGPDLATIIESSADLAQLFADRSSEVQGVLKQGTKVGEAFVNSSDDFERAIRELVTVSQTLSDNRDNLTRLLNGTNSASDEVVSLLRNYKGNVNKFLHQFAEVNELQAQHADDLTALFVNLPDALDNISHAFEPDTGLVRFGLIQDNNNPGCSYGTERRRPSDREPQSPPENAQCGSSAQDARSTSSSGTDSANTTILGVPTEGTGSASMPSRMAEWSWTLFYLNGI
ncbi:MAG: phospholipid/cholesterol/gamma-HCH transport system substrate-binding protein [Actinomycetota bacterium]|nr:phospholipid/cholesterol/gamma-HCH transport system substrate-binding protein [Actinomycetota bacterium]